jgi:hypothetical protein
MVKDIECVSTELQASLFATAGSGGALNNGDVQSGDAGI